MAGLTERAEIVKLALGYVVAQALCAAAKLGIADLLAAGLRDIESLAAVTRAHGPSLYRLLRTLCSAGIFVEDEERRFALTALGETLRTDVPGSVRAAVIWIGEPAHYRSCGDVLTSVLTGRPAFEGIFGAPCFDYLRAHPQAARIFNEGMASLAEMENEPIARSYRFPARARVVDVGGGRGGFLVEVLKANPSVRGVLYDRPEVVKSPQLLEAAGVIDRCAVVGGNFFESLPLAAEVYVFKRVLHDWDDDTCVALLRRCRSAMSAGGRVLVIDAVIPPGNDPHPAKIVDLIVLASRTGRERTESEFRALFAAAGLRLSRVLPTPSELSIVEGVSA
jgi:hypothetical protein